jgi:hypothetical protein
MGTSRIRAWKPDRVQRSVAGAWRCWAGWCSFNQIPRCTERLAGFKRSRASVGQHLQWPMGAFTFAAQGKARATTSEPKAPHRKKESEKKRKKLVTVRLGTPVLRVWFNSRMRPRQGRDNGGIPFTRSIHWERSSPAERSLERTGGREGTTLVAVRKDLPPIFRGHSSVSRAVFRMHQVEGAIPSALTFLSLWCSPAHACFSCRRSPERSRSGPRIHPPKHSQRCVRSVSESVLHGRHCLE